MEKSEIAQLLARNFPRLNEPELINAIVDSSQLLVLEQNKVILEIGAYIAVVPLALRGSIKVTRVDGDGNELFLYYIREGETCAMTISACLHEEVSLVRANSEEACVVLAVPVSKISLWQGKYTSWRRFLIDAYDLRFREMISTIDSIAFRKLDERLANWLNNKMEVLGSAVLNLSHQNVADELHASREVISRLLKQLEKNGRIKLSRNRIEIIDLM